MGKIYYLFSNLEGLYEFSYGNYGINFLRVIDLTIYTGIFLTIFIHEVFLEHIRKDNVIYHGLAGIILPEESQTF